MNTSTAPLPEGVTLGRDVRIAASELVLGEGVKIGDGTVIAGDRVRIGAGTSIGPRCDLRASDFSVGEGSEIGSDSRILVAESFAVGMAARLSRATEIICRSFVAGRLLYFGHETTVGYGGTYESTAIVRLGDRVALGPHNILNANHEIHLQDDVGSGSFVTFWTHGFHFGHSVLDGHGAVFRGIAVQRNVWLGFHVTLLPGVTVGENTIVAAGSLVTRDLPADCLAAGIPAQARRLLDPRPLSAAQADEHVAEVLESWGAELKWKGLSWERVAGTADQWIATGVPGTARVVLLRQAGSAAPDGGDAAVILVSVVDRPDVAARLPGGWTLFEIRSRRFTGASTPLSEDLRDHLRRHTLGCGDARVFCALEPEPFVRLRRMV